MNTDQMHGRAERRDSAGRWILQASVACLVTSIAPVALQLLTASPLAAEHPEGVPAAQIFASYQDAMNRHDADAVAAYWVLTGPEVQKAATVERWRGYREFERATNAVFAIDARAMGGDAFEVTQREDCDFYEALGTGTKTSVFRVHLRDGKFQDVRPGPSSDSGRPYGPALDDLQAWIRKERPQKVAEVLRDGEFVFDARTAETIMELVRERSAQETRK